MNTNTRRIRCFWLLCLMWLCMPMAQASTLPSPTSYNPKPAIDDLILPMPEGVSMVFRAVKVPGSGFWGDPARVIQIGDASGGIFEGLQRTQISGSFPSSDGRDWFIYLGKYELTKEQFMAVMGLEGLLAVSNDPLDQTLAELQGRARRDALMQPLSFVSYQDIQVFLRRYNQWLFDPQHPERIADLPRMDGVPGFMRLPTEEEWEYVARGGLPALEAGQFEDRLPFASQALNEHAWHLGNARHQLRPIGMRAPNALGFHDLLGNVQEMTAGLFRPEIWQGKPGGIAVRGGSVSTPAAEMRTAWRAELDAYAWNADLGVMEERRSFNTGARLAIGSNVVVNSQQRARIEQEYEDYRAQTRRAMPVGRTLDNLVAQASVQLGTVEPLLERLMGQYPELRDPLQTIQVYMERARERLELAQRETARSLAQDAARNGTNLSIYLARQTSLQRSRTAAQQLAELSGRYQQQLASIERAIDDINTGIAEQLAGYREKVSQLGEYEAAYIDEAISALLAKQPPAREQTVLGLLKTHVAFFSEQRRAEPDSWLEDFKAQFVETPP